MAEEGIGGEAKNRLTDFLAAMNAGSEWYIDTFLASNDWAAAGLLEVAQSFVQGAGRVYQLGRLLSHVHSHGCEIQYIADVVRFNESGSLQVPRPAYGEVNQEEWKREDAITLKIRRAQIDFLNGKLFCHDVTPTGPWLVAGTVTRWNDTMRQNTLRGYFDSIVILSWTAFESVAEDLWEAAVNARPSKLAKGKIAVSDITFYGFEVRDKLGTISKKLDGRSFATIWDIQEAYEKTFSDQGSTINGILKEEGLVYSAAVRNLLIHKGGRIDKEYQRQVSGVSDAYKGTLGEQFPLTGVIAAERSNAALSSAACLLKAVHAWIIGHPES
ncbi:MAG TPA: hypothetical protein VG269_18130 [Tepidisphaeraceae bacterium]|jgi:hypothetical protein|nr:hypothetical protein [Tepidisphaeraceae bacterium]